MKLQVAKKYWCAGLALAATVAGLLAVPTHIQAQGKEIGRAHV